MGWRAGQRVIAAALPQQIAEARSSSDVTTNATTDGTAVTLLSVDVFLDADKEYRLESFARARWVDSAANDAQAQIAIWVADTQVAIARNRPESTSTARTCSIRATDPAFSPATSGVKTITMRGRRTSLSGTASQVEFRGSGGPEFDMWLSVSTQSPAD